MQRTTKLKLLTSSTGQQYVFDLESARIGGGAFGEVYRGNVLVNGSLGEVVAVKCIYRDQILKVGEELYRAVGSEVNILQQLVDTKPPHIIRIYDCFETKDYIHIILEFCDRGTLKDVMEKAGGKIPEETAVPIFYQVLQAVDFLSRNDITHRDIKPENVFIKEGEYKLGDFGFATAKKKLDTFAGTLPYMAPEIVADDPNYDKQVDIWSLGVMFHEMLFENYPFQGNQIKMTNAILNNEYMIPDTPKISENCKNLLRKCLTKNPSQRITAQEMIKHPLFSHLMKSSKTSEAIPSQINLQGNIPSGSVQIRNRTSMGIEEKEKEVISQSYVKQRTDVIDQKIKQICNFCMTFHNSIFTELKQTGDNNLMNIRFYIIKYAFRVIYNLFTPLQKGDFPSTYLSQGDLVHWETYRSSPLYTSRLDQIEKDKKFLGAVYDAFYKDFALYINKTHPQEWKKLLSETYCKDITHDLGVMFEVNVTEAEKYIKSKIEKLQNPVERRPWFSILAELMFFHHAREELAKHRILNVESFVQDKSIMSEVEMIKFIKTEDFRLYAGASPSH